VSNIRGEKWLFSLIMLVKLVKRRNILDRFQADLNMNPRYAQ